MHTSSRRNFLKWSAAGAAALWAAPLLPAAIANASPGTPPSLDSLKSDWLQQSGFAHAPAISNFWGAVNSSEGTNVPGVSEGANVLGVQNFTLPPYAQNGSCCDLTVDGAILTAASSRWSAYEILRRVTTSSGLAIRTATRLAFESNQLLLQISVSNPTSSQIKTALSANLNPRIRKATKGWNWFVPRPGDQNFTAHTVGTPIKNVMISDNSSAAVTAFAIDSAATLTASGTSGTAVWNLTLAAGATKTLRIAMAVGDTSTGKPLSSTADADSVVSAANTTMQNFTSVFDTAGTAWSQRWNDAFTAGNSHYSGSLPVLTPTGTDTAIASLYYMSILSVLACERTNSGSKFNTILGRTGTFNGFDRVYVTAAPEYAPTLTYFWDTSYCSVLLAMLDPAMVKTQTKHWLSVDIHNCYAIECMGGGTEGPWYSANDLTVSSTVLNYIYYSGDLAYLQQSSNNKTVLQHLTDSATYWKGLVKPGQNLADYGNANNLLEVLWKYTNQVASFNAANVWLMNQAAALQRNAGNTATAKDLEKSATDLLPHVLDLYDSGQGVWNCRQPDGTLVSVRTVVDFAIASNLLADHLSSTQKTEMKHFVETELLHGDWMRALSLSDAEAPALRPDHGSNGAYDAWPAMTAQTFAQFGDYTSFLKQLKTFSGVTSRGPLGQAHEFLLGVPVPDRVGLNPSAALTLSAWVNAKSWPAQIHQGSIIAKDTWTTGSGGYVLRGGSGGKISFAVVADGNWVEAKTTTTVPTGGWHHVAGVYDGATMKIYIDGVQQASQAQSGKLTASTGTALTIGNSPADSTREFRGRIDEVRVYSRALSATDITHAYEASTPDAGAGDSALVLRLPFGEGSGEATTESITGAKVAVHGAAWSTGKPKFGNCLEFSTSASTNAVNAAHGMAFNEVCSGKFADVIITDLFGYNPVLGSTALDSKALRQPGVSRGYQGTLSGVRFNGKSYTITSGSTGLSIH
ncbi:LamG domain-containing protein [Streptomyces tubercidicus]|uniref:LamG domain-containing protein n=1 Tax=Streptomyces tubercidicus TaxID=47759 RepID=UPI0036CF4ABC